MNEIHRHVTTYQLSINLSGGIPREFVNAFSVTKKNNYF